MVIVAHPDDAEFGPSGTAAAWIDDGSTGWLVCCTSGDQGGEDPDADPLALAALREREQRAACAVIGYEGVTFLHQPDGALANDLALREHAGPRDPDVPARCGPGDRPGGALLSRRRRSTTRTIARPGSRPSTPSIRRPATRWRSRPWPGAAWPRTACGASTCSGRPGPNVRIDITATLERKIEALAAHASQIHEPAQLAERIRDWAAEEGAPVGVAAAEALRLIVIDDDEAEGPG